MVRSLESSIRAEILNIIEAEYDDDTFLKKCDELVEEHPEGKEIYVDYLLNLLIWGLFCYDKKQKKRILNHKFFSRYSQLIKELNNSHILTAVEKILLEHNVEAFEDIKQWLSEDKPLNSYEEFVYVLMIPLKNGYPGMWNEVGKVLDRKGLAVYSDLCYALEEVYYGDTNHAIDKLCDVMIADSQVSVAYELLGYLYFQQRQWKNSLYNFRKALDYIGSTLFFYVDDIHFYIAYCYGKINMRYMEEQHYRKSYEINPDGLNTLNNLGHCLFMQKKYEQAKNVLEKCINEGLGLKAATNNLIRVYLRLGDVDAAKRLVKSTKVRIAKDLIEQLDNASDSVKRIAVGKLSVEKPLIKLSKFSETSQFSSEQILEDEIVNRMDKGLTVFGLPLKVYETSESYGRQFITPIGRLDILSVDDLDNLYIIELKKDSGYGNSYEQITRYVKWIEENVASEKQKVYGFLCMNSPSEALLKKVKANPKLKIYEYTISFSELA